METCQVLLFIIACMDIGFGMYDIPGDLSGLIIFSSQIPSADWFAFGRYLRLQTIY